MGAIMMIVLLEPRDWNHAPDRLIDGDRRRTFSFSPITACADMDSQTETSSSSPSAPISKNPLRLRAMAVHHHPHHHLNSRGSRTCCHHTECPIMHLLLLQGEQAGITAGILPSMWSPCLLRLQSHWWGWYDPPKLLLVVSLLDRHRTGRCL